MAVFWRTADAVCVLFLQWLDTKGLIFRKMSTEAHARSMCIYLHSSFVNTRAVQLLRTPRPCVLWATLEETTPVGEDEARGRGSLETLAAGNKEGSGGWVKCSLTPRKQHMAHGLSVEQPWCIQLPQLCAPRNLANVCLGPEEQAL